MLTSQSPVLLGEGAEVVHRILDLRVGELALECRHLVPLPLAVNAIICASLSAFTDGSLTGLTPIILAMPGFGVPSAP